MASTTAQVARARATEQHFTEAAADLAASRTPTGKQPRPRTTTKPVPAVQFLAVEVPPSQTVLDAVAAGLLPGIVSVPDAKGGRVRVPAGSPKAVAAPPVAAAPARSRSARATRVAGTAPATPAKPARTARPAKPAKAAPAERTLLGDDEPKTCNTCKRKLHGRDFTLRASERDGRRSFCRSCASAKRAARKARKAAAAPAPAATPARASRKAPAAAPAAPARRTRKEVASA